ncbi:MAG: hypothetical protein WAN99_02260 [Methanoculleus sp.]|jgi:hypothetical protein
MKADTTTPGSTPHLWIGVPAVAFGGIGLEMLLFSAGFEYAAWAGIVGCVVASFILFYQAYNKPRRDIVSLFVPLYAVLIFIVPNDISKGLIVQVFYAATITLLTVRVEKLFNAPKQEKRTMKQMLNDYIGRIEPLLAEVDEETGHAVAQSFLIYKFGLYKNAVERCTEALDLLEAAEPLSSSALEDALLILRERAGDLARSRMTASPEHTFSEDDYEYLAIHLRPEQVEIPATLDLDNALILLYAVGVETSPDDELALEEHQRFIIQILESYREKLTA